MVRRVEFSATVRTVGGVTVLETSGEIDLATAERFQAALVEAASRNSGRLLVVDLTGVKFMGAEAAQAIFEGTKRFRDGGGEVRLAVRPEEVDLTPRLTGIDRYFAIYPDAASAANEG